MGTITKGIRSCVSLIVSIVALTYSMTLTSCCDNLHIPSQDDIVILYDNDVHCAVDGYAKMAALKKTMLKHTDNVAIVSCGDFAAGDVLGAYSQGDYIARIMNAVGYQYVVPGNHEFDYRMPRLFHFDTMLESEMLCCNFRNNATGKKIFKGSRLHHFNKTTVAFVGVTTPGTPSATSPIYFTDSLGHPLYSFCFDSLVSVIQREVDNARDEDADYVVLLSHLGDREQSPTSIEIIRQTTNIDVVLDGHSHSRIPFDKIANKDGNPVVLSSTGSRFANIGCVVISADGSISTQLIPTKKIKESDATVSDTIRRIRQEFDAIGQRPVGISCVTLKANDVLGRRLPRVGECMLGDLCADALRATLDADIGWINGGGVRTDLRQGDIHFSDLYAILPFNNQAVLAEVCGQDILDALEVASATAPVANGRFAQVSGLRYTIDTTIHPIITYRDGFMITIESKRRISDVKIKNKISGNYEPISSTKTYTIATTDYVLNFMGSGSTFPSKRLLKASSYSDAQILEQYVTQHLSGRIDASSIRETPRITYK